MNVHSRVEHQPGPETRGSATDKRNTMKFKTLLFVLSASAALLCGAAFAQPVARVPIRGAIAAVDATSLTVRRQDGTTVRIATAPDLGVNAFRSIALADIKPGSFIGTATKTLPNGEHVAMEVHVFPESARGTGEGNRPWDVGPGGMMTNGNVDEAVQGVDGRTLTVSYKGGAEQVTVPEGVPVVTPIPATRADLLVGKRVFLIARQDGSNLSTARVSVEKDGVVPPM
jgi:hypothetical protein